MGTFENPTRHKQVQFSISTLPPVRNTAENNFIAQYIQKLETTHQKESYHFLAVSHRRKLASCLLTMSLSFCQTSWISSGIDQNCNHSQAEKQTLY